MPIYIDVPTGTLEIDVLFDYHDVVENATTTYDISVSKNGVTVATITTTFEVQNASSDCSTAGTCPNCIGGCGKTPGGQFLVCKPEDCDLPGGVGHCHCSGSQRPPIGIGNVDPGDIIRVFIDSGDDVFEWDETDNESQVTI